MPPGSSRSRPVHSRRAAVSKGDRTRGRIIDSALELASVDGLSGMTIGALAEYVGMSKGGLFAHFRSKEELQLCVVGSAIEKFRGDVVEPVLAAQPGLPRLRAALERWIEWDGHERLPGGCPFVGFAAELDAQPGGARDMLVTAQARWLAFLARIVAEAVDTGELHADTDPERFAFLLHGVLLSYHQSTHLLGNPQAQAHAEHGLSTLIASAPPATDRPPRRPTRR